MKEKMERIIKEKTIYIGITSFFVIGTLILLALWYGHNYNGWDKDGMLYSFILGTARTILVGGFFSFLLAWIMRDAYAHSMIKVADRYYQENKEDFLKELTNRSKKIVKESLPDRVKNYSKAGIGTFYKNGIDERDFVKKLRQASHEVIRIDKIWFPGLDKFIPEFRRAIDERNNQIKFMVSSPGSIDALKKRAELVDVGSAVQYQQNIESNLYMLQDLKKVLKNKSNLEIRLSDSFFSVSLIGIGETYWQGYYLNGRYSCNNITHTAQGAEKPFYKKLNEHFWAKWSSAIPIDINAYNRQVLDFRRDNLENNN